MTRERGSGFLFRKTYRDKKTGELRQAATLTMRLWHHGKALERSSGETSPYRANKRLEAWKKQLAAGTWTPDADKTTFDTLSTLLLNEYRANGRRSTGRVEDAVDHLREFFTKFCPAYSITTDRVLAYVCHRQETEKAANATINRELSALKRMFRLGEIAGKVTSRPHIEMLEENNVRKGFFEPEAFDAVLRHLPDDLKPVFEVAYITGWRVKSEILTRRWQHVDSKAGWAWSRARPRTPKVACSRCCQTSAPPWSGSGRTPRSWRSPLDRSSRGCSTAEASESSPSVVLGGPL
jgi:hypothetical protein